ESTANTDDFETADYADFVQPDSGGPILPPFVSQQLEATTWLQCYTNPTPPVPSSTDGYNSLSSPSSVGTAMGMSFSDWLDVPSPSDLTAPWESPSRFTSTQQGRTPQEKGFVYMALKGGRFPIQEKAPSASRILVHTDHALITPQNPMFAVHPSSAFRRFLVTHGRHPQISPTSLFTGQASRRCSLCSSLCSALRPRRRSPEMARGRKHFPVRPAHRQRNRCRPQPSIPAFPLRSTPRRRRPRHRGAKAWSSGSTHVTPTDERSVLSAEFSDPVAERMFVALFGVLRGDVSVLDGQALLLEHGDGILEAKWPRSSGGGDSLGLGLSNVGGRDIVALESGVLVMLKEGSHQKILHLYM
ncbi:2015_t:CDS:2, partial [Scutellospora calospora]